MHCFHESTAYAQRLVCPCSRPCSYTSPSFSPAGFGSWPQHESDLTKPRRPFPQPSPGTSTSPGRGRGRSRLPPSASPRCGRAARSHSPASGPPRRHGSRRPRHAASAQAPHAQAGAPSAAAARAQGPVGRWQLGPAEPRRLRPAMSYGPLDTYRPGAPPPPRDFGGIIQTCSANVQRIAQYSECGRDPWSGGGERSLAAAAPHREPPAGGAPAGSRQSGRGPGAGGREPAGPAAPHPPRRGLTRAGACQLPPARAACAVVAFLSTRGSPPRSRAQPSRCRPWAAAPCLGAFGCDAAVWKWGARGPHPSSFRASWRSCCRRSS